MKELEKYLDKIEKLMDSNQQYKFEAYGFVMSGLHHTVSKLPKARHVTGKELVEGLREYTLDQFGPLCKTVLNYWGIYKTQDFGKIVFALVEAGILRKQADDKVEEFDDVYDFDEVFNSYRIKDE